MKDLFSEMRSAVVATLILAAACCGVYPLVVFGLAQTLFHERANGSLIVDKEGIVRGSRLLGQNFSGEAYFHPRPSAADNGYDASNSGGSNLGPTSRKLNDAIKERIATYRTENGIKDTEAIPADAVTASASGLDPHISVRNADLQAARVARARGLDPAKVLSLIRQHVDQPNFGLLGEPGVKVLELNLALDGI
ncbi:MAG TPA: K(+)-transporting ATPase subunit C [Candidatus Paceibacterota bacterium]|nr:K(+)-transporting ATPase subunit C [Candidatus Paceibacterota bacterium]